MLEDDPRISRQRGGICRAANRIEEPRQQGVEACVGDKSGTDRAGTRSQDRSGRGLSLLGSRARLRLFTAGPIAGGAIGLPRFSMHASSPMNVVALVTEPDNIARYLRHLGEPVDPPPLSPARGPPYYQSRLLRRRPEPEQTEMFDA